METQTVEQKRALVINERKSTSIGIVILFIMYGMVYYIRTLLPEAFVLKSSPEWEQINRLLPQVILCVVIIAIVLTIFKLGYLAGRLKELE